jgi:RNA polymerase sigma factor (sigma-70 family)
VGAPPPRDWVSWHDEELVSRAQVRIPGSKDLAWGAFEALYQRYGDRVYQTIYRLLVSYLLPDHYLAQDIQQEVFLQVWQALPDKKRHAPFEGWIMLICTRKVHEHMRKLKRKTIQGFPLVPSDPSPDDTEKSVLDAELRSRIERTKACLTKRQLMIFTMHYEEGLELKDIAKKLGLKPATIWTTFWRANERFKEAWLKEADDDDFPSIS